MRHAFPAIPVGTLAAVCAVLAVMSARPASAQVDVSGEWAATFHEDLAHRGGMRLGDYTGLPLNDAGRLKAESWEAGRASTRERQCIPHVVTYAMRGPANIRMSKAPIPLPGGSSPTASTEPTAARARSGWTAAPPSELAPHTWAGFSTGKWERQHTHGRQTTHIKTGWIQRNGRRTSDLATMTEHFIRHGDNLLAVDHRQRSGVPRGTVHPHDSNWVLA